MADLRVHAATSTRTGEAVFVEEDNLKEVAEWCSGELLEGECVLKLGMPMIEVGDMVVRWRHPEGEDMYEVIDSGTIEANMTDWRITSF